MPLPDAGALSLHHGQRGRFLQGQIDMNTLTATFIVGEIPLVQSDRDG